MAILHVYFTLDHYDRIVKNKLFDETDFIGKQNITTFFVLRFIV